MAGEAEQVAGVVHPLVHALAADERRCPLLHADDIEKEEQQDTGEDQAISIGDWLKILLIAAILIAHVMLLLGQALQISKSLE